MKILYILLAIIILSQCCDSKSAIEPGYIAHTKHFLRIYPKRLDRALKLMPEIERLSAEYSFDPIVPVITISHESAWRPNLKNERTGARGLMQVLGVCARGYNLDEPVEQIHAGIACLSMARNACDGSLRQTLTMFQSGSCTARTETTKRRVNHRLWLIKKWSTDRKRPGSKS